MVNPAALSLRITFPGTVCGVALDAICPYSHRQMSMFKPVGLNMATATPLGPPGGPRQRRSSTPGCSS